MRRGEIRAEVAALKARQVDQADLCATLARFDPIWDSLTIREQARIFQLLVERVGYDGAKGAVAITFRSSGIRSLAAESFGEKKA